MSKGFTCHHRIWRKWKLNGFILHHNKMKHLKKKNSDPDIKAKRLSVVVESLKLVFFFLREMRIYTIAQFNLHHISNTLPLHYFPSAGAKFDTICIISRKFVIYIYIYISVCIQPDSEFLKRLHKRIFWKLSDLFLYCIWGIRGEGGGCEDRFLNSTKVGGGGGGGSGQGCDTYVRCQCTFSLHFK